MLLRLCLVLELVKVGVWGVFKGEDLLGCIGVFLAVEVDLWVGCPILALYHVGVIVLLIELSIGEFGGWDFGGVGIVLEVKLIEIWDQERAVKIGA